jgi:hypothetical protein
MRLFRHGSSWLAGLLLVVNAVPGRADAPATADPLRLVPAQADVILKVEQPRQLVETLTTLEPLQPIYQLQVVREYLDSTNARRLNQLLSYFEKELGVSRLEMLDRLAGGGAVAAVKFAPDPVPALLVIQGKDEELLRRFIKLAVEVVEQELARQDNKGRPETTTYRGIDGLKFGDKLFLARVGAALLIGSTAQTVQAGIDLHLDGEQNSLLRSPRLAEGRQLLTGTPLLWLWLNFEKAREQPKFKVVFDTFTTDPATALFFGGLPDVLRRTPCLALGLFKETDGFALRLRYPRGRDGMGEAAQLVLPGPDNEAPPLLEPKNVAFSASYYLDLHRAYTNRTKLLNAQAQKGLQELEKKTGPVLGGKLGEILSQAGAHQRLIATAQDKSTFYKRVPPQRLGAAYAVVQEMRDPAFAKSVEGILRAVSLFGIAKFGLKSFEDKVGDVTLVCYRFSEETEVKEDKLGIRYNFTPCFGAVGNQFFVSSTVELGRELVGLLQKEAGRREKSTSGVRAQLYFAGQATGLRYNPEQAMAQAMLTQALTAEDARKQAALLVRVLEGLGTARLETSYDANVTRYDLRLTLGKAACCCDE